MKLTELEPRWIYKAKVFAFRCPHCRNVWLTCKTVEMDHGKQFEIIEATFGDEIAIACKPSASWKASGLDFEKMTVTPSLDASAAGHWHGFITDGQIVGGL